MRKNNLIVVLFFISLGFFNCYSQDTTRILILDIQDISHDTSRFSSISKNLSDMLCQHLNGSEEMIIVANNYAMIVNNDSSRANQFVGVPSTELLESVNAQLKNGYSYFINGRFWYSNLDQIGCEIYLFDAKSGIQKMQFVEHEATNAVIDSNKNDLEKATFLIKKIASKIEFYLLSKIVLGIVEFQMTDNDSAYKFLEKSIPSILISSLANSRRYRIKEINAEDAIDTCKQNNHHENHLSAEEIKKKYTLNYLITGEYFELDNKIRIDARCISMTTLEILISDETIFKANDLDELSKQLNELATRMRIAIENDFNKKKPNPKSIAVIAFQPQPNNRTTLLKSNYIRKTLVKKLRLVSEITVIDKPELTEIYLNSREDKFKICSDLGVSNLLSFEYYEFEDESPSMDVDIFSIEKPDLELYRGSSPSDRSLDWYLNQVIDTTLNRLEIPDNIPDTPKTKRKEIKITPYLNRWTIGFRGANVNRANEQVYLSDGLGDYWEIFLTLHENARFSYEIILGYDFGKKLIPPDGEEARVSSTQIGVLINYKFCILPPLSLYCGTGLSGFLVYRGFENYDGNTEEYGAINGGIVTLLGLEIIIRNIGLSLFVEPRYVFTGNIPEEQSTTGFIFPGGKLGGFYLTAGIGYNFNWPEWL